MASVSESCGGAALRAQIRTSSRTRQINRRAANGVKGNRDFLYRRAHLPLSQIICPLSETGRPGERKWHGEPPGRLCTKQKQIDLTSRWDANPRILSAIQAFKFFRNQFRDLLEGQVLLVNPAGQSSQQFLSSLLGMNLHNLP